MTHLIEALWSWDSAIGYAAFKGLLKLSQGCDAVYPDIDQFCQKLNSDNFYCRTRALILIVVNTKWEINHSKGLFGKQKRHSLPECLFTKAGKAILTVELEGLAVSALVHGGVLFVRTDHDFVKRAIVLGLGMVFALMNGAADAGIYLSHFSFTSWLIRLVCPKGGCIIQH